jgi:hypothetical protein
MAPAIKEKSSGILYGTVGFTAGRIEMPSEVVQISV